MKILKISVTDFPSIPFGNDNWIHNKNVRKLNIKYGNIQIKQHSKNVWDPC